MRKKLKKSLSWLLAICMILSLIPTIALAAGPGETGLVDTYSYYYSTYDRTETTKLHYAEEPSSWTGRGTIGNSYSDSDSLGVGETGTRELFFQFTQTCPHCYNYCIDRVPEEYYIPSVEQTGTGKVENVYFSLAPLNDGSAYSKRACLQLHYTAVEAGTVQLSFKVNQNYNYSGALGLCRFCYNAVQTASRQWIQNSITVTINIDNDPTTPTIPDDSEVDITHEVYIPAGYDCGMTFDLTSGATLSNLQVVSADSETATIEGELINNSRASVTIDAHKTGDTAVYCMFEGGYSERTVEKILVHVYDPDTYQLPVAEGEKDTFTHRVTVNNDAVGTNAILFDMTPQINSGSEFVTISPEGGSWVQTVEGSAAVVIPVTGTAEGQAVIETQFGFVTQEANGQAIHLFVDVVNVTVTEPTPPAPTIDEKLENVYLNIEGRTQEGATPSFYQNLDVNSSAFQNKFLDTVTWDPPVYDGQNWTVNVTVAGYSPTGTEDTHVVNYFLRGTAQKGWGLADGEQATKTIQLTYVQKSGNKSGWYDSTGEEAVLTFFVAPQDTSTAPDAPDWTDVYDLGNVVTIDCTNESQPTHAAKNYTIAPNTEGTNDSYVVSEVAESGGEWTCTVTVYPVQSYLDQYHKDYLEHTYQAGQEDGKTLNLTWDDEADQWTTTDTVTFDVECAPVVSPVITDFTKSLVTTATVGDLATSPDVTIPEPGQKIIIPANGTVTLLYKLTVHGVAGTAFTITDNGVKQIIQQDCNAVLTGNEIKGTIPNNGIATIYVTKTFTASDITEDGYVTNTASIAADDGSPVAPGEDQDSVQTPAEEGKPNAPAEDTLKNLLNNRITVDCITTEDTVHPSETYGWLEGGYSRPAAGVTGSSTDGWKYVVTINADVYVNDYDTTKLALPIGTHTQTGDAYTITLTWDGQGWSCAEYVDIEVKCTLYTLTYDANGGTFTDGQTTYIVSNIQPNTEYTLDTNLKPTKSGAVFIGWTTTDTNEAVYGAGQQLPTLVDKVQVSGSTTVYAVWGEDTNGDGIADAQQILITPADITVYAGGTSYAGVVDENGSITSESSGIPEPGYYFTLPYELNQTLQQMTGSQGGPVNLANHIRLTDRTDGSRQWILQLYDGTINSAAYGKYIYRLAETATGNSPAKLVIKDGSTIITDDELYITNDALYKTYTMSLDTGAAAAGNITVEISADGNSWSQPTAGAVNGLCLGEGTLTVRGTDNSTPTLTTDIGSNESDVANNHQIANEESQTTITAVAPEGTDYTINGSDVTTGGSIGLLTDGLLPNDVLSGYLDEHNLTDENTKVDYQYLDLVDMSNGNAYVTADSALDIYWKLPADADVSGDFYVVHFNGLDRNYDVDQLDQLIGDANHAVTIYSEAKKNLDVVTINGEQYLKFATSSFSPFALVYDTKDEPVVEKVTVTFDSGKHGDFGWYHVTSKDVELTKGDKLAAYQIPYVFEDEGYEFIGWYKQGSGSWHLYSDEDLLEMTFTSDTTFIAQYKYVGGPSVDDEYDVVYNANFTDGGVPRRQGYDKGETVTVSENKWFERDGYIFVGWNTEADGTGDSYDPDDTFKMPGRDVYLYAQWQKEKPGPDDTGVSRWLETEDHNAYLTGYPDSTFGADRNMTRAEVAQMFYSLLKNKNVMITTSFSDVSNDAWYATAVKTMASLGMMSGYPDGTFRPDEPITRAEFATVALAFAYEPDNARCSYLDVSTSAWYYTYVAQATTYGWIGGYPDGTFRPNNSITRVEVCVIVNNMLGRTPDEDYIDRNEDELVNFVDLSDRYWGYYTIMEATNGHEYTGNYSNETWKDVK